MVHINVIFIFSKKKEEKKGDDDTCIFDDCIK